MHANSDQIVNVPGDVHQPRDVQGTESSISQTEPDVHEVSFARAPGVPVMRRFVGMPALAWRYAVEVNIRHLPALCRQLTRRDKKMPGKSEPGIKYRDNLTGVWGARPSNFM
ncbi:hypothetical protein AAFG13_08050 [Bradyrhizobium sp. B124]|uniref:hypothetical protein n=1 Tax=Bradyrhizobium sp. B124 TaxID=3140245 RepID=UPI003182EAFF